MSATSATVTAAGLAWPLPAAAAKNTPAITSAVTPATPSATLRDTFTCPPYEVSLPP